MVSVLDPDDLGANPNIYDDYRDYLRSPSSFYTSLMVDATQRSSAVFRARPGISAHSTSVAWAAAKAWQIQVQFQLRLGVVSGTAPSGKKNSTHTHTHTDRQD